MWGWGDNIRSVHLEYSQEEVLPEEREVSDVPKPVTCLVDMG